MSSERIVLKELSRTLNDQKLLLKEKQDLEKRIILKLNVLGIKGTSYSDVVIRISGIRDKYSEAFARAENLINRRDEIAEELNIIDKTIRYISETMKNSKLLEYEVFNLRYFEGLTLREIAKQKHYSLDRIKQISSDIAKKFTCQ